MDKDYRVLAHQNPEYHLVSNQISGHKCGGRNSLKGPLECLYNFEHDKTTGRSFRQK